MGIRRMTPACGAFALLTGWLLLLGHGTTAAARTLGGATNSRPARDDATKGIPFAKLDPRLASRVQRVVSSPSVFRRLPVQMIDCDPRLYHFMLSNPEVIVNIWQAMGITKVQLTRTGPTSYEADDGAGAAGTLHIAYSDQNTQVVYCEGVYQGPMFPKPLRGQCVLLLKAAYKQDANGRYYVTTRCDTFIHLDNMGVELLAKTFQSVVNKSADLNFIETASFVSMVSRTSEVKPTGMARLGNKLENVSPPVREEFITLTQQVGTRAQQHRSSLAQSGEAGSPQVRGQR